MKKTPAPLHGMSLPFHYSFSNKLEARCGKGTRPFSGTLFRLTDQLFCRFTRKPPPVRLPIFDGDLIKDED